MPNIWKRRAAPAPAPYAFPPPQAPAVDEPFVFPALFEEDESPGEQEFDGGAGLSYAAVHAKKAEHSAKKEQDDLAEMARLEARREAEAEFEKAREEGRKEGYDEGYALGLKKALEEGKKERGEALQTLSAEVERWIARANETLDRQMDANVDELRDLAIAVAEKVISVSLRSSSEVVGRMIQSAVDRRKHQEWVRIYVAESAGQAVKISPTLSASLSALSDSVRIIPINDDDPGTCIIEMPDEILDASVSTQLNNIRTMLSDIPYDEPDR